MILYLRQTSFLYITKKFSSSICLNNTKFWNYLIENYKNVLVEPNSVSKEIWKNLRNYAKSECDSSFLDSTILSTFYHKYQPNTGICYYKFLEDNNYNPSVHTIIKYLELYHIKNDLITEVDKKHILSLYNKLMTEYSSFNANIANILVKILCKINQWKEAIKVIEKYEVTDKSLLRRAYNDLIAYLFDHNKDELAYKYLINSMKKGVGSNECIYITYLKYCLKEKDTFNEKIEKIFILWNTYGIKPTQMIAFEYMTACIEHGWSANPTTISNLRCNNCKENLSQINISDRDFKYLLEVVEKNFTSSNMYYLTLPEEINKYMMFIKKNKPFDIIIDGLNVMYAIRYDKKYISMIVELIKSYEKQNKKILFIGRIHMKSFIKKLDLNIKNCFLLKNWTHDDLFVLYAAFSSGKNAIVISKDLMRKQKFTIQNKELNILFNKWQFSYQYYFDKYKGLVKLNSKTQIDAVVQKKNNYWHIPYIFDEKCSKRHTCFNDWICLKI